MTRRRQIVLLTAALVAVAVVALVLRVPVLCMGVDGCI